MTKARDLCRGHKQLLPLVEYALKEGWVVSRTSGGHLRFIKPGLPPIYTSSTVSDHRGFNNAQAMLKRVQRQAESDKAGMVSQREGGRYG
ncbi:TPA: type II toxin-antitoxin system HicA family toxin [Salmonella enterica]|uniref:Type II toxin-antitoxin system HicA family toxin n=1 Tax=Salmonella enterica TaxID=28901 RepID=A0A744CCT6_SALER|nr:type II toxin-antitoxin system HicA family toxin [Salmonella enterica]HAF4921895.1 type II toxin-antitoxin system HicA family toxin [Salmonella enterica]